MSDTQRTMDDLLTNLFQDGQGANSISAQDMRDLIWSLHPPHGGASMEANATTTTFAATGVFVPVAGTWIPNSELHEFTISAAGLATYIGVPDRHCIITCTTSFFTAANNKLIKFQWFHNGTTPRPAPIERKVGTSGDVGSLAVAADVHMQTGDTFQLKVANMTDTTALTVQDAYFLATSWFG